MKGDMKCYLISSPYTLIKTHYGEHETYNICVLDNYVKMLIIRLQGSSFRKAMNVETYTIRVNEMSEFVNLWIYTKGE